MLSPLAYFLIILVLLIFFVRPLARQNITLDPFDRAPGVLPGERLQTHISFGIDVVYVAQIGDVKVEYFFDDFYDVAACREQVLYRITF